MNEPFHYTGTTTLEILTDARRYNRFLETTLRRFIGIAGTALDFGAGIGTFAGRLRDAGIAVECIEPDSSNNARLTADGFITYADLSQPPKAAYPRIYTLNVLEHIEDDAGALAALHTLLAPGGRILIYVPAFQCLYSDFDAAVGHVRRYGKQQLRRQVEAAGFSVCEMSYVDSIGFFAWWLMKHLSRGSGEINPRAVAFFDRYCFPASRALDSIFGQWLGKNLLVIAEKSQA